MMKFIHPALSKREMYVWLKKTRDKSEKEI